MSDRRTGISHSLTVGAPFPGPAVAALRPLIVSNELFSNDGLEVVAIFFFASFSFLGCGKKLVPGAIED